MSILCAEHHGASTFYDHVAPKLSKPLSRTMMAESLAQASAMPLNCQCGNLLRLRTCTHVQSTPTPTHSYTCVQLQTRHVQLLTPRRTRYSYTDMSVYGLNSVSIQSRKPQVIFGLL